MANLKALLTHQSVENTMTALLVCSGSPQYPHHYEKGGFVNAVTKHLRRQIFLKTAQPFTMCTPSEHPQHIVRLVGFSIDQVTCTGTDSASKR